MGCRCCCGMIEGHERQRVEVGGNGCLRRCNVVAVTIGQQMRFIHTVTLKKRNEQIMLLFKEINIARQG